MNRARYEYFEINELYGKLIQSDKRVYLQDEQMLTQNQKT